MGRPKKDARYLNVYIRRDIYNKFAEFCSQIGQSKTVATERALIKYMNEAGQFDKLNKEGETTHE